MRKRILACLGALFVFVTPVPAQTPEILPEPPQVIDEAPAATDFFTWGQANSGRTRSCWASAEFLLAFVRGTNAPVLATTSPSGTPRAVAGVIGAGGTETLFGGWVNEGPRSGIRIQGGWWFRTEQPLGVEAGFTILQSQTASFSGNSTQFPILASPYINASSNTQQAVLAAFPGSSTGALDVRAASHNFSTAHVDLTEKALDEGWYRLVALLGYRFYRYDETLAVSHVVSPTSPLFIPGTQLATSDNFHVRNEFHGMDFGFRSQFFWDRLSLDVLAKIAVGKVYREVNINGSQTVSLPGAAPQVRAGGTYALVSNSGLYFSNDWKVMPEFTVGLGWRAWSNVNLRVGYTFLLLNGVARAADQVDVHINPNLFPPPDTSSLPSRPAFSLNRTDLWVQSINFGVEVVY